MKERLLINKRKFKIGIFDSGLGGLTILGELQRKMPEYNYIYLADTLYSPYGNKSQDFLFKRVTDIVNFFVKQNCILIIVACNTASTKALKKIQDELLEKKSPVKVLGVLIPTVEAITEKLKNNEYLNIGILATQATVRSKKFPNEIKNLYPNANIISQSAPLLVPALEKGIIEDKIFNDLLKRYLKRLKEVDYLVLACTHFPILEKQIRQNLDISAKKIINTPKEVASKLRKYLIAHKEIETKLKKEKKTIYFTTKKDQDYRKKMENILRKKIVKLKFINI